VTRGKYPDRRWTLRSNGKKIYLAACNGDQEALADMRAIGDSIRKTRNRNRWLKGLANQKKSMKHKIKLLASIVGIVVISGCAVTRQVATSTETNQTNGVVTVHVARSTTYSLWDASASVDKVRASSGKTASVGATGADTLASSTNLALNLAALSALLNALK